MTSALMPTYARQPVAFVRGEGPWLYDIDGNRYLDAVAGVAVCGLGHAHPELAQAIGDQAATLIHTSNLYQIPLQEELGRELVNLSGMDMVFFGNSGAEANEAAIKLARLFGHKHKHIDEPAIIVMEGSFHGRTLATLSATGNKKIQAGFEPLVSGFVRVPYGNVDAIAQAAKDHPNIVAILVEPIQGEGGVRTAPQGFAYLEQLRAVCDQHDWLLMLDEIQTGNGRTGTYFAYQHTDILPDVVSTAKGLGNGFPIGACLARGKAADLFGPGHHGSTYGGTPLACRAALTTVRLITNGAMQNAAEVGPYLMEQLRQKLAELDGVSVRGAGLMIGVQLPCPCGELVALAREQERLLINVTSDNVIRLIPPLILSKTEADQIADRVARLVHTFLAA